MAEREGFASPLGVHAGMSPAELIGIDLLNLAVLGESLTDSIEQSASTDGIARSALGKETDALAVGHLLVGPNPADR